MASSWTTATSVLGKAARKAAWRVASSLCRRAATADAREETAQKGSRGVCAAAAATR